MGSREQREVTPRVARPALDPKGHEGDVGATRHLGTYDWTTELGLGWKLVLQPQDHVTEIIGKDGAAVRMDSGILKWD